MYSQKEKLRQTFGNRRKTAIELCDSLPFSSVVAQASGLLSEAHFLSELPETLDPLFKFHETIAKVSHMHRSVPSFQPLTLISSSCGTLEKSVTNVHFMLNIDALKADEELRASQHLQNRSCCGGFPDLQWSVSIKKFMGKLWIQSTSQSVAATCIKEQLIIRTGAGILELCSSNLSCYIFVLW